MASKYFSLVAFLETRSVFTPSNRSNSLARSMKAVPMRPLNSTSTSTSLLSVWLLRAYEPNTAMEAIGYFCSNEVLCCWRMLIMSVLDYTFSKTAGICKGRPSGAPRSVFKDEWVKKYEIGLKLYVFEYSTCSIIRQKEHIQYKMKRPYYGPRRATSP